MQTSNKFCCSSCLQGRQINCLLPLLVQLLLQMLFVFHLLTLICSVKRSLFLIKEKGSTEK